MMHAAEKSDLAIAAGKPAKAAVAAAAEAAEPRAGATTRKGRFSLHRKTRRDRLRAKLREVKQTLRRRRHEPIAEQGAWLRQVVCGFFADHAVPNNIRALGAFRRHVGRLWRRALRRHSQKDRTPWGTVAKLADHWLPKPHIIHPWPDRRFAANHPSWETGAGMPHAGFCAGGAP